MNHIDEVVEVDTTEIWEVKNTDGEFHNFHVHDVQFQVLDVDGQPPAAQFAGWKDTVFLKPGSEARLAMRFSDYTDPIIHTCCIATGSGTRTNVCSEVTVWIAGSWRS